MSNTCMYIFVNKGLGMSSGKAMAQAAHAAVEAYLISKPDMIKAWRQGLHYAKIVLEVRDEHDLKNIEKYLSERGFKPKLIIDEGLTEVDPMSPTALGVEIVDKDDEHVAATFGTFKLYRDTIKVTLEIPR